MNMKSIAAKLLSTGSIEKLNIEELGYLAYIINKERKRQFFTAVNAQRRKSPFSIF